MQIYIYIIYINIYYIYIYIGLGLGLGLGFGVYIVKRQKNAIYDNNAHKHTNINIFTSPNTETWTVANEKTRISLLSFIFSII